MFVMGYHCILYKYERSRLILELSVNLQKYFYYEFDIIIFLYGLTIKEENILLFFKLHLGKKKHSSDLNYNIKICF